MYRLVFELGTFRDARDREWLNPLLGPLVMALAGVDVAYLRRFPNTPSLYESGVRYSDLHETCDKCEDLWWDIPVVLAHGFGDCEDLAAWRIAELWQYGVNARPFVTSETNQGGVLYHIQVQFPDGRVEDPSRILGMGSGVPTQMMAAGSRRQRRSGFRQFRI